MVALLPPFEGTRLEAKKCTITVSHLPVNSSPERFKRYRQQFVARFRRQMDVLLAPVRSTLIGTVDGFFDSD